MIGAEVGGAVKNVLAIACGVVIGAGLGENARAAVISRGYAEMLRFGLAKGAAAATLGGLSGLGDLVLTCGSVQSRNMSLGVALGQGRRVADVLGERRSVAEGAVTAPVLQAAAARLGIDMPIVAAVAALLAGEAGVAAVIERLLSPPAAHRGLNARISGQRISPAPVLQFVDAAEGCASGMIIAGEVRSVKGMCVSS